MWYPFKFWRNVHYQCIDGVLAEEVGHSSSMTWKRRRRARLAHKNSPGFRVAVVYGTAPPIVEGWFDTPDHRFSEVALRFPVSGGEDFWISTGDVPESQLIPIGDDNPHVNTEGSDVRIECRSGTMIARSTTIEGRLVTILHRPGSVVTEDQLRLVDLGSLVR